MADRRREEGRDIERASSLDPEDFEGEHGEPREYRFGRSFERHEPGELLEQRHEVSYSQPYDRWSPDDYVFYSGHGYHREFVEPYKDPDRGFSGRGPRGYVRPNERIREEVCERLSDAGELDASGIEVTVEGGEVTLEGEVPDRASKRLAEDVSDSVRGVRQTHNRLRVRSRGRAVPISRGESRSQPPDVTVRGPAGHSGSGVLSPPEIEPLDSGQASPAFPPHKE